jgi:endonuclease/exonuclease/phosphatase family metal-dependent hydrolase
LVGIYGITLNRHGESCGHGRYSVPLLLKQLAPLFESDRADRIIVAGDFNMWPCDVPREFNTLGLVDLIADTAHTRPALANCSGCDLGHGCGHLWTHRNGTSPNAAVQQIDYIFATAELRSEVSRVYGGVGDFPEAWDVSDHAPVVAEFF